MKQRGELDPSKLPPRAGGYTVAEIAKFYKTTLTSVRVWMSRVKQGQGVSPEARRYTVERIRTEDRFNFRKRKKK